MLQNENGLSSQKKLASLMKDRKVEIKVDNDRRDKPDLLFDPITNSWSFEVPLSSVGAAVGLELDAKMKLKREDKKAFAAALLQK